MAGGVTGGGWSFSGVLTLQTNLRVFPLRVLRALIMRPSQLKSGIAMTG